MNKIYFGICLHFHQPVGNFDNILERAYQNCYKPFLDVFEKYPDIKMAFHFSGCLLDYLEEKHPEFLDKVKKDFGRRKSSLYKALDPHSLALNMRTSIDKGGIALVRFFELEVCPVLKDKVAVITGAGRGLGKAFALKYAGEGARLLLPDISLERAEGTVKEIKAKGGRAAAMMTDISSEEATKEMADRVMELYGRVDILVNNAAIWYGLDITPWDAWTVEDWERILKVNVIGTWLCCKAIAPLMARGGGGKIINIASNVAQVPAAQVFLPYACSKGTMYTLTHALARALEVQRRQASEVRLDRVL